jgi:hypothetical protein
MTRLSPRRLADQAAHAACLSLVVNCIAAWNAAYLAEAVDQLRAAGLAVATDDIGHLGPTMCEQHTNVHGRYHFNLDQPPKSRQPSPGSCRRQPVRSWAPARAQSAPFTAHYQLDRVAF